MLIVVVVLLIYVDSMLTSRHWPMASVANSYARDWKANYKNLRDATPAELDTRVTCELSGKQKRWSSPPEDAVQFLFGVLVASITYPVIHAGHQQRDLTITSQVFFNTTITILMFVSTLMVTYN